MNLLPDINVMHPQVEPAIWSKCIYCGTEIFEGEEHVEHGGWHHCDVICLGKSMIEDGDARWRIAGE